MYMYLLIYTSWVKYFTSQLANILNIRIYT